MSGMNKTKPVPHMRCSLTYHVEVDGTVEVLLLPCQWQHLFVDARDQDVALRVHHATHQLHQVRHRLVSVDGGHNTITITVFMLMGTVCPSTWKQPEEFFVTGERGKMESIAHHRVLRLTQPTLAVLFCFETGCFVCHFNNLWSHICQIVNVVTGFLDII